MSESIGGTKARRESATGSTASENRKLRNRLSQKAFRARQSVYIKELERRLEDASKSETERNADLEERNTFYRDQLLESHKKLESLQVSLQAVLDSVAGALGLQSSNAGSNQEIEEHSQQQRSTTNSSSDTHTPQMLKRASPVETDSLDNLDFHDIFMYQGYQHSTREPIIQEEEFDVDETMVNPIDAVNNIGTAIPSALLPYNASNSQSPMDPSLYFSYADMGHAYSNLINRGPVLLDSPNGQLHGTNSLFSDHITTLEHLLSHKLQGPGALMTRSNASLEDSVTFMISMFVSMSWTPMGPFYDNTKALVEVNKLTTWRVNPTKSNYAKLSPAYRPTHVQVSIPHPTIIDWVPYPSLRDKLILYHAGNPRIDDFIREVGQSYVVEASLSDLVTGLGNVPCYLCVWDLVRAIAPEATGKVSEPGFHSFKAASAEGLSLPSTGRRSSGSSASPSDQPVTFSPLLPAPNIDALFTSSTLALAAFRFLGMDRGAARYKVDPILFEKHPELYDPKADLMAKGIPIRPTDRIGMPVPGPLDSRIVSQYEKYAAWTMSANGHGDSGSGMERATGVQAC